MVSLLYAHNGLQNFAVQHSPVFLFLAAGQYPSASGAHPDDYVPSDVSHFRIAQEFNLNDVVSRALMENQSGYRAMGSFPALRMAYAFVETNLYIWPWENARNLTIIEYPEFITAVGLLSTLSPGSTIRSICPVLCHLKMHFQFSL